MRNVYWLNNQDTWNSAKATGKDTMRFYILLVCDIHAELGNNIGQTENTVSQIKTWRKKTTSETAVKALTSI